MHHGKESQRKPIVEIAAAHNIPYAASASIAFFADFQMKLRKAAKIKGPTFVTVNAPCALGAGFDGAISMKVARLAVQSRMWFLFEYENGNFKLNFNPKAPKPVAEYLQLQKRFRHLTPPEIESIQRTCDHNYFDMLERQKASDVRKAAFEALNNPSAAPVAPAVPATGSPTPAPVPVAPATPTPPVMPVASKPTPIPVGVPAANPDMPTPKKAPVGKTKPAAKKPKVAPKA